MSVWGYHANDDKSPLIGLLNCIVCKETMKLEKSAPDAEGKDIIRIVASNARELSGCDSSAEVEMRRAEGEGDMTEPKNRPPVLNSRTLFASGRCTT
jgi:hypothetical protein